MSIKTLDCTIRDGGHLNKWNFDIDCVKASYSAARNSGTSYFEIGYRTPKRIEGLGSFAYCDDSFLLENFIPYDNCKLTIMIDAGKSDVNVITCDSKFTPIKAIRIAAYPYELEKAFLLLEDCFSKGYEVFLNLMAFSEFTEKEFNQLYLWNRKDVLTAIYFADSFGSFLPTDIDNNIVNLIKCGFNNMGFHSHNNLQLAFANTLEAIKLGCKFIDASIYGMGRGSGNLQIEVLIAYLEKLEKGTYNPIPYLEVIQTFFIDIFKQFNWGYNVQSLMGGMKNIHPYYITNIFDKQKYSVDIIWGLLDTIKKECPISFSAEKLNEILEDRFDRNEQIEDNTLTYIKTNI